MLTVDPDFLAAIQRPDFDFNAVWCNHQAEPARTWHHEKLQTFITNLQAQQAPPA